MLSAPAYLLGNSDPEPQFLYLQDEGSDFEL
jgi:hypothetical protein